MGLSENDVMLTASNERITNEEALQLQVAGVVEGLEQLQKTGSNGRERPLEAEINRQLYAVALATDKQIGNSIDAKDLFFNGLMRNAVHSLRGMRHAFHHRLGKDAHYLTAREIATACNNIGIEVDEATIKSLMQGYSYIKPGNLKTRHTQNAYMLALGAENGGVASMKNFPGQGLAQYILRGVQRRRTHDGRMEITQGAIDKMTTRASFDLMNRAQREFYAYMGPKYLGIDAQDIIASLISEQRRNALGVNEYGIFTSDQLRNYYINFLRVSKYYEQFMGEKPDIYAHAGEEPGRSTQLARISHHAEALQAYLNITDAMEQRAQALGYTVDALDMVSARTYATLHGSDTTALLQAIAQKRALGRRLPFTTRGFNLRGMIKELQQNTN